MKDTIYRGMVIRHDPLPIPIRHLDYEWMAPDFDGGPLEGGGPPADARHGRAASIEDAKTEIDLWYLEHEEDT